MAARIVAARVGAVRALGDDGEMDLGDRGGGDRLLVEALVKLVDRPAQFRLDDAARLFGGEGWQLVLQLGQVGGDGLAHQIGPGGQDLAELDEAGAEIAECGGQPLAGPPRNVLGRDQAGEGRDTRRHVTKFMRKERVVTAERAHDHDQAGKVADRADHRDF